MTGFRNLSDSVTQKEVLLFVLFYALSSLIYYTATWITWGGLDDGNTSFFDPEEYFAAAGTDFIISFLVTIPIWYLTSISFKHYSDSFRWATHILFLPLYLFFCYHAQTEVKNYFGWAMFWGGKKVVWTFYNLMLFYIVQFSLIHAYTYFQRFRREEKEKYELRETVIKSELVALKAQLNPHFLHNLFNSVNASLPPENEKTRELIIAISDLFRYQNYAAQQEWVTLKEEIDFIENYLQLMKVRLKERLTYHIQLRSDLYEIKIPPMLLQPLVENAVNHGIAPATEPAALWIKCFKNEKKLTIVIEDSGLGIKDKKKALETGIGLSNTRTRLKKLYDTDLKIEDHFPTGTKISFTI